MSGLSWDTIACIVICVVWILLRRKQWKGSNFSGGQSSSPATGFLIGKGVPSLMVPLYIISGVPICALFYYAGITGWQITDVQSGNQSRVMGPGHFHK
jgi:4-amino-4-deoxy-L-arabinose transferase-like glycosyltransferase